MTKSRTKADGEGLQGAGDDKLLIKHEYQGSETREHSNVHPAVTVIVESKLKDVTCDS